MAALLLVVAVLCFVIAALIAGGVFSGIGVLTLLSIGLACFAGAGLVGSWWPWPRS